MQETKEIVDEVLQEASDFKEVEEFFPMEEEKALHIINPHSQCSIYKAKSIKKEKRGHKIGLSLTFEKEDRDTGTLRT